MALSTFNHLESRARVMGMAVAASLALFGVGCGDAAPDPGVGNACGFAEPDCLDCAQIGECCLSSTNCPVGTICNLPTEALFDSTAAEGTCLKVTCETSAECDSPKVCSLEKICKVPVCQVDTDCSAGDICIGGTCAAAPAASDVSSCEVTSSDATLAQGGTVELIAVGRNANGVILAGVRFTWASSDTEAVSVTDNVATGGTKAGASTLTASIDGGPNCTGQLTISNYAAVPSTDARIVVVTDGVGTPVSGAMVSVDAGGDQAGTTDATGAATFTGLTGALASVTVTAPGYEVVTVIQPGSNDIFIPLPRQSDDNTAGGFRGLIDISNTARGDIQLGFAGPALPTNLLDFGLDALVGDLISTEIEAPELQLDLTGEDAVDLPGGLMVALGNRRFTSDGSGSRCQGTAVTAGQIGCFLARAPEGRTAGWALAGQLKLKDVTSLATTLSDALGGTNEDLPIGDLLVAILPLLRNLNHAIVASLDIQYFPKVGETADYTRYEQQNLNASQSLSVLSVIDVPNLPGPADDCANAAIILAGANLEGRGLVPLGITAGLDTVNPTATPDCRVDGVQAAFGAGSADTQDGQMALSMAPLHSGAEGSETFLLLVAADIDRLVGDNGLQASAIVQRTPNGVQASQRITGSYLDLPTGTVNSGTNQIALTNLVSGAVLNRYELQGGGQTWIVYAPSSVNAVALPDIAEGRAVTGNLSSAYILSMGMEGQFAEVFRFGSGKTLDRLFDTITGFSVQQCASTATAPCLIQ